MKFVPRPLPPIPTGGQGMDRFPLPLPLPFSPDLLWRYPLGFPSLASQQTPSSPLLDYKSQLPNSLPTDPRIWSRDDVITFLRWAEREFDLQPFDMDVFQMNGKAMCLLTRNDLSERVPGSGDVLHNILQLLVREANNLQRCLPSSPITPTSRHPYPLSPHTAQPPTPNWNLLSQATNDFHPHAAQLAAHLMAQSNSVTLSPAPSVDSQAGGSPQHAENTTQQHIFHHSIFGSSSSGGSNGSGSNQSDSDEEFAEKNGHNMSPPNTPTAYSFFHPPTYQFPAKSPKEEVVSSPSVKREFFPSDTPEPNTNGRLLWDFLQQLLNDPNQRYTNFIAWKNQETGVFKIVDPAGLAKLWGIQKNHLSMNYDKMSRALRYYYRVNILRKVQGERHCYQFLRNPTELKNIKNISLLRQQMSPTRPTPAAVSYPTAGTTTTPSLTITAQTHIKPEPLSIPTATTASTTSWSNGKQQEATNATSAAAQARIKPESISIPAGSTTSTTATSGAIIITHAQIKPEPVHSEINVHFNDYDDMPTDLSMNGPTDLSSNTSSKHVNIVCSPDTPNLREPMNYYNTDDSVQDH